jgi:hypothetical protein
MKKKRKTKISFLFGYKFKVRHNPELDKYEDKVLAPEALDRANETLSKVKKFPPPECK